jgi:TonB family protein
MMPRFMMLVSVLVLLPVVLPGQAAGPEVVDCRVEPGREVDQPVARLTTVKPVYPDSLRDSGLSVAVRLRFVVCTDGTVDSTSLAVRPSIDPRFDRAAGESVLRSTYRPALRAGQRVAQVVEANIRFTPPGP